jgi:FPC/CPF motif-containing protein YcgG
VHVVDDDRAAWDAIARQSLHSVLADSRYPCLGARSVFNRGRATVRGYPWLGTTQSARALLADLALFAQNTDLAEGFASFVAVFLVDPPTEEETFERMLWRQLRDMAEMDTKPWDRSVSDDPNDVHFAFSAAGNAYFVIGMHPAASRPARRSPLPTLVFNPHEQFERLRAQGRFERLRDTIRRRDAAVNGSINPMVADHGAGSEARQYSGRRLPEGWVPPYWGARPGGGAG